MYKVHIAEDNLQQSAILRRQKLDEDRKRRVFDSKTRVLGIDVKALEEQIRIKNEMKLSERQRDLAFDRTMKYTNDILTMMDEHVHRARRDHLTAMNNYRKESQRPDQRRDFDLYDPNSLLKDMPARVGDDDSRCGVSGMQKFDGEDLDATDRAKQQKEQIKVWTNQQIYEKMLLNEREKARQRAYEGYERNVAQKAQLLQSEVERRRAEQARIDNEINLELAHSKRKKEAEEKALEIEMNNNEINNYLGEFPTEAPEVFKVIGGRKVRVNLFRGISSDQKAAIIEVQEQQRKEAEEKRELGRQEEMQWAFQQAANLRASLLLDREKARLARELAIKIRQDNQKKALTDKERRHYIDKVLYTNPPTEEYFGQFNKTAR